MLRKWVPATLLICLLLIVGGVWLLRGSPLPVFGTAHAQSLDQEGTALVVQEAQGSAISYQGRLLADGEPVNGLRDFQFRLYDTMKDGEAVGPLQELTGVNVSAGLFNVVLDFGTASFDGDARYLEVRVRANGSADPYTVLRPRQRLQAAPYALHAATVADGAVQARSIGEGCAYGQVLATDGQSWTCASAPIELGAAQQVSHEVEIGGILAPAVRADLPTLRASTQVTLYRDGGTGQVHKIPGEHNVDEFYFYCPFACPTLTNWYADIRNGITNRATVSIILYDGLGSETSRYNLSACWPSALGIQLSQDGTAAYPRYEMACETMALILP